jgi:hypothetical protein
MSSRSTQVIHDTPKQQYENVADADVERYYLKLRGKKLTAAIAFVAGTGFTLFGSVIHLRDQGNEINFA